VSKQKMVNAKFGGNVLYEDLFLASKIVDYPTRKKFKY
jgi:hypothetical protein